MSNIAPSGDTSPIAAPEVEPATTDTRTGLVLPDQMPGGTNPFRVIDWILFTAHVAARHLTDARRARVGQLGRKMRTEDRDGVLVLHWEDDVDWRAVEKESDRWLDPWWKAHSDARKLCAGHGIPFTVYDPLLKAAWNKLEETWSIIRGVASDKEVYPDHDLSSRLHELTDSTTPIITPAVNPPIRHATEGGKGEKQSAGAGDFLERLLPGPADVELTPRDMALLEAHLKQPISLSAIQREKAATGTSRTQANRNKLMLIRDFNRRLQQTQTVDDLVCKLYVGRPHDLDPELADAFSAVATGIRECTRLMASVPHLWTDEGEYCRLAACVAEAATAARAAFMAVDIRLRRAGGPNPMRDVLNDVLTVQGRAPLDPTGTPGGLNAILTNLYTRREELFPRVERRSCIDRMLDQLARVPPATNTAADPPPVVTAGPSTMQKQSEGDSPKKVPKPEAETRVRNWLLKNAKDDPASVTRDAVAAGTGVSAGAVSNTSAWKAFRKRRDAEAKPEAREVPLTDAMRAVVPGDCATPDELAALIEEQKREQTQETRRHKPRHGPS